MDVGARRARASDIDEVVRLVDAAVEGVDDLRGAAQWQVTAADVAPRRTRLIADLNDGARTLVTLGTIDEVPVGIGVATIASWRDGTEVAVIRYLFVEPPAREVGVGEAILDEVIAWAGEHGCMAVESLALPGDRELKNMFERFGLVARAIVVHKSLRS